MGCFDVNAVSGHFGLQDGTVASYFAMSKAFQGSKTAESPSQQGLGLPKSVFKFSYFAEIGNRVKTDKIDPLLAPATFPRK